MTPSGAFTIQWQDGWYKGTISGRSLWGTWGVDRGIGAGNSGTFSAVARGVPPQQQPPPGPPVTSNANFDGDYFGTGTTESGKTTDPFKFTVKGTRILIVNQKLSSIGGAYVEGVVQPSGEFIIRERNLDDPNAGIDITDQVWTGRIGGGGPHRNASMERSFARAYHYLPRGAGGNSRRVIDAACSLRPVICTCANALPADGRRQSSAFG